MFLFRLYKLKWGRRTPLYVSLLLPLLVIGVEEGVGPTTSVGSVTTSVMIHAPRSFVWESIKNVRDIHPEEVPSHVVHLIGVPKPVDGRLDRDGVGGVRSITWEKGMHFREVITGWREGWGYDYDIDVDPTSIPPTTLDEHVVVGGEYFDVLDGGYRIDSIAPAFCRVTLRCRYRVTTTFNFYCRWWADYLLNDFNEVILEVIRQRCELSYFSHVEVGSWDRFTHFPTAPPLGTNATILVDVNKSMIEYFSAYFYDLFIRGSFTRFGEL